jgi:polysaccharide deacetylase family protein (PEP-CTERM system associated)
VRSALTFDVEDYFMVSAFEPLIPKARWDEIPSRIVVNTLRILSLLDEFQVKATFFVLGWVGEKFPELVQEIHGRGHEVACHGYDHQLVYRQTPQQFRQDVRCAKGILERASGAPVYGYRAPSFSVVKESVWALEVLKQEGFLYDASVLPAPHARGGMAGAQRFPGRHNGLWEFPMSTVTWMGKTWPFSGGGYFRLFPYRFIHWGMRRCLEKEQPAIVYLHPWEFDPEQPRLRGRLQDRFRHYVNLRQTEPKLRRLLADFSFGTVREILKEYGEELTEPKPSPGLVIDDVARKGVSAHENRASGSFI